MSRIGKKPVAVPSGVTVTVNGTSVIVQGPKGKLERSFHPHVRFVQESGVVLVSVERPDAVGDRALWGLTRKLLANMIDGVTKGFTKKLELVGVGYKASVSGQTLTLNIGFTHPVLIELPTGIAAAVEKNTLVTITGMDKELVGNITAKIRAQRPPEPYKGKGIKYVDEVIRRKLGKAVKTAGAA